MPAAPPSTAINASRVHISGASHRTKANDVNENMNAKRKAEPIEVLNIGHQKYLARLNRVFPIGSKRIDSSNRGGIVAIFGSTKRMTRAILNQAWASNKAIMWPEFSIPVESDSQPINPVSNLRSIPIDSIAPPVLKRARNPIAATMVGVTKGRVNAALMKFRCFH